MKRLYRSIVNHPKQILIIFLLATICGLFLQSLVGVNYDMTDYLPDESHSTISLELMQEEFEGGIPASW